MARGIPVNQNLYPVCTPGLEGKVVESKGNKKTPWPTNQQQNTKTNTPSMSGVQKGRRVSKWLQSESTAMWNNSRGEVQFKESTSRIKNDQTIFKVQEMVNILPRCTNYSKWSCIGNSCSWTIFKLFLNIWDAIYLPEYKSTWVDHWSTRTQCEAPKDVVSCSNCECKPVKYFFCLFCHCCFLSYPTF